jgi:adenylate cyclase
MFTDIRGFTSLSERLAPDRLVELLNEYFTAMTDIIFKYRGTLDKYIGDAIMAFWGAPYPQPEHAELACRTGIEMIHALEELQLRWRQQGLPYIDIGIGINTGSMLVGNVGSLRRFNFTIMGDNVNQAQRLESLNKAFGTRLIISDATYRYVQGKFPTRELDLLRVKGKAHPVMIYQVFTSENGLLGRPDLLDRFHSGLRAYRVGQWNEALASFGQVMREFPEDGPSRLFVDRCWDLLQEPPEEWDGVFVMKSK